MSSILLAEDHGRQAHTLQHAHDLLPTHGDDPITFSQMLVCYLTIPFTERRRLIPCRSLFMFQVLSNSGDLIATSLSMLI